MSEDEIPDAALDRALRLIDHDGAAEYEIDLSGLDLPHTLASIDRMVERQRFREEARRVRIRLDPATEKSGETLFQPVGRHLLEIMKKRLISRCMPMAGDAGSGFLVVLPGRGAADDA